MENIYDQLVFAIVCVIIFVNNDAVYANVQSAPTWITMETTLSRGCVIKNAESVTGLEPVTIERNASDQTCSFVIGGESGVVTGVQMLQGYDAKGTDYLYMERTDGQDDDKPVNYTVLSIADQNGRQPCCTTFTNKRITFHIYGNIRLHLQSPLLNHSQQICPFTQLGQNTFQNWSACTGIKEYPSLIQCYYRNEPNLVEPSWGYDTRCDLACQTDCSCALDNRQVTYRCPHQESHDAAFITYPSNVSNLNFSRNNLSSITAMAFLSIGSVLKKLDFGFNSLVVINLAFQMLSNLQVLYLNDNRLTNLSGRTFESLVKLQVLDLSNNELEVLEDGVFHGLHSLSNLYLMYNRLSNLNGRTFGSLVKLRVLDLSFNELKVLEEGIFHELHSLTKLFANDNRLTTLHGQTFANLGSLQKLHLQRNDFLTIHDFAFNGLQNLTELNLFDSQIQAIPDGWFGGLVTLQVLHLEHNELQSLEVDVFDNLGALEILEMNHNRLTFLKDGTFQNLENLRALILAKNELQTLKGSWFAGLDHLQELELWGNHIATLEAGVFKSLDNLKGLHLQGNMLEILARASFAGLRSLERLDVYKNRLVEVQPGVLDDMKELQKLSLSRNNLSSLPSKLFKYSVKLQFLDLSQNQLIDLPFVGHLSQLQQLIIQENELTNIEEKVLYQLPATVKVVVTQPEICLCFLNNSDDCNAKATQSPYLTCKKMLPDMVLVIFMWVGGFGALFGNAFVLFWRKTQPQEEYQVQKILIGNLALADLFMGMYMVIIASADIHYGDYFPMNAQTWRSGAICRIAGALAITSSEASIMMLTVISIDRLVHIRYQINKWKPRAKSTQLTALGVWLFALVIASAASFQTEGNSNVYEASNVCVGLPLAMKKMHKQTIANISKEQYTLTSESYYEYWQDIVEDTSTFDEHAPGMYLSVTVFLGLNLLCCVIIVACYIVIVITVFKSVGQIRRQRHMRHELRMTVKVVAIVATDLCCWCPIILTSILVQAGVVMITPRTFVWIVTFILPINSVINPYLYTLGNVIADRLPKPNEKQTSNRTTCTNTCNTDRFSRHELTVNQPSQYVAEESDYTAPLEEKKPFVVMETCV